ncbi:MAG: glycosyltransferase family 4 protein [Sandaracinus sp.]
MRVGMITTSYPSHEDDAAGRFVRTLAVGLARRGHALEVVAPSVGRQDALDAGIDVHRVRYAPAALERTFGRFGAPDNLARDPLAWPGALSFPLALAHALRAQHARWDAIVSHFVVPTTLVAARFAAGRPHVAVAHGTDVHVAASVPGLAARVRRSGARLVCVSTALAARLEAPEAIVQPMPIADDARPSLSRNDARARLGLDGFVALSLSRLVPIKGVDAAIRAVAGTSGLTLVVAGDGPERSELERLATSLAAPVRFVGHVSGDALGAYLAAADVLVAPSRALGARVEGTPTSVLEALRAGLPIVGSRISGIGEVVPSGAGLLADDATPAFVRSALATYAGDAQRLLAASRAARFAGEAFGADRVAARFEAWLEEGARAPIHLNRYEIQRLSRQLRLTSSLLTAAYFEYASFRGSGRART